MRNARVARAVFATGIIALGIVGMVYGDFAGLWQAFPASAPVRLALGHASAALMLICGVALMVKRTEAFAARALLMLFSLLLLVIKLPPVLKAPLVEGGWQSMSEMLALLTGAWVLCASGVRATRLAQLVFGFALIPFGLSHFAYLNLTAPLIPAWLPFHTALAYFTGAAQVAAGLAILVNVLARLAATLEAVMLSAFTVLVWVPMLLATPSSPGTWSEFATSWAISGAAWVVAMSIPRMKAVDASFSQPKAA